LYGPLIAERDEYMAAKLLLAVGANGKHHRDVLAVVGAGHLKGITAALVAAGAEVVEDAADGDARAPATTAPVDEGSSEAGGAGGRTRRLGTRPGDHRSGRGGRAGGGRGWRRAERGGRRRRPRLARRRSPGDRGRERPAGAEGPPARARDDAAAEPRHEAGPVG